MPGYCSKMLKAFTILVQAAQEIITLAFVEHSGGLIVFILRFENLCSIQVECHENCQMHRPNMVATNVHSWLRRNLQNWKLLQIVECVLQTLAFLAELQTKMQICSPGECSLVMFSSFRLRIFSFTVHKKRIPMQTNMSMESNINHTTSTNQNTKHNRNRKHKSSCAMCLAQKRLPSLLAVAQQFRPGPSEGGDNWNFDSFWKRMVQSGAHRESVFFDATMQSHGVSSLSHLSIQLSQNAMHHFSQLLSIMCTTALSSPAPLTFIVDKRVHQYGSLDHVTGVHPCVTALRQPRHLWQRPREGSLKWPISSRIAVYKGQRPQHLCQTPLQMCQEAPKPSQFIQIWNQQPQQLEFKSHHYHWGLCVMAQLALHKSLRPRIQNRSKRRMRFFMEKKRVLPRHLLAIVVLHPPRCLKKEKKMQNGIPEVCLGKNKRLAMPLCLKNFKFWIHMIHVQAKYPELYRLDEFQDQPFDIYRVELTIDEYRHWLLEEFVFELGSQWLEWDVQHHRTTWCGCRADNGIHREEGTCHLPPREMEKHRRHHLRHPGVSE